MDQTNQTTQPDYELKRKLRYAELVRVLDWHKRNIKERLAHQAVTLEYLVGALREPRGITKSHAEAFRDYIRSIVKAEIAGVQ